jgi:hypothetical protein
VAGRDAASGRRPPRGRRERAGQEVAGHVLDQPVLDVMDRAAASTTCGAAFEVRSVVSSV